MRRHRRGTGPTCPRVASLSVTSPTGAPASTRTLSVRAISEQEHRAFVESRSGSFLQTPAWGRLKNDWRSESLGFQADGELVGTALVLSRQLPRVRRSLAYVPEGPVTDWESPEVLDVLRLLRDHVKAEGAFALRIGPPVPVRRWQAATIKAALAAAEVSRLGAVPADVDHETGAALRSMLRRLGFSPAGEQDGFGAGQPQFVFQVPLAGRTEGDLLKGMNQLWRRNIKKADKAGVEVSLGTAADLAAFHEVYGETAQRDHFLPRPLDYFRRMVQEMTAEDPDRIRLYLAHHEGDLVAATTWVQVGRHTWYSYGASTSAKREVQGSTAVQWRMMRDALSAGADVYDLRGITETVSEGDPHVGLIRFKVGTGGEAVEYAGEWDLPLNPLLYKAFRAYLARRGGGG